MQNKVNLRHTLLTSRDALSADLRAHNDLAIGEHVINWLSAHPAKSLGVYWPIRNEPDLHAIYPVLAAQGVQLALPVVTDHHAPLKFLSWMPGDELAKDKMG